MTKMNQKDSIVINETKFAKTTTLCNMIFPFIALNYDCIANIY